MNFTTPSLRSITFYNQLRRIHYKKITLITQTTTTTDERFTNKSMNDETSITTSSTSLDHTMGSGRDIDKANPALYTEEDNSSVL